MTQHIPGSRKISLTFNSQNSRPWRYEYEECHLLHSADPHAVLPSPSQMQITSFSCPQTLPSWK